MAYRKGWLTIPGDTLFYIIIFAAAVPAIRQLINLFLPNLDPFTKFFALILIPAMFVLGLRKIVQRGTENAGIPQ